MNDQGQCKTCESLAHELAKGKLENKQLRAILNNERFEAMETAEVYTSEAGAVAPHAKSKWIYADYPDACQARQLI